MDFLPAYVPGICKDHCLLLFFACYFQQISPCPITMSSCLHWIDLILPFSNKGDLKTRGWELEPYAVAIRLSISGFWYPRRSGKTIARLWLTSFLPRGWWIQTITKRNQFTFPQGEMSLKELVRIIVISISIYLYLYLYNKLFRSQIESWFKLYGKGIGTMLGLGKKIIEQQFKHLYFSSSLTKKYLTKPTRRKKDFFWLTILGTVVTRKPWKQECEATSYILQGSQGAGKGECLNSAGFLLHPFSDPCPTVLPTFMVALHLI